MKCFLTGGTGMVGRTFLPRLLAQGWEVTLLTRDPSKVRVPNGAKVEFIRGDLDAAETVATLESYSGRFDVIFHLAASLDYFGKREALFATNTGGTERMVRFARRVGAQRFVHASSIEAAGSFTLAQTPAGPTALGRPISAYGESKLAAERAAQTLNTAGIPTCSLRIGNVYVPGELNLIVEFGQALVRRERLHEWLAAYGDRYLSPVHNEDVADGLLAGARNKASGVFNLVGQPATVEEIFRLCAEVTGTPWRKPALGLIDRAFLQWHVRRARTGREGFSTVAYVLAPEAPSVHRGFSMADTRTALAWQPSWSLRNGIRATLLRAREQGHLNF